MWWYYVFHYSSLAHSLDKHTIWYHVYYANWYSISKINCKATWLMFCSYIYLYTNIPKYYDVWKQINFKNNKNKTNYVPGVVSSSSCVSISNRSSTLCTLCWSLVCCIVLLFVSLQYPPLVFIVNNLLVKISKQRKKHNS